MVSNGNTNRLGPIGGNYGCIHSGVSPTKARSPVLAAQRYDRLVQLSRRHFYNAFETLDWPAALPHDQYWMSPDLLTVAGTDVEAELSEAQLITLSRFESLNLCSMLVHGERDACRLVLQHIHTPAHATPSEYFHHFIEEENKHMWFFSQFCHRYGGKIYPYKAVRFKSAEPADVQDFVLFAQIMIFEEINDFFNARLKDDERLPPLVREINRLHHQDETRHLAMNRVLLQESFATLRGAHGPETLTRIEAYLKAYTRASLEQFYSPAVYRDAGLPDPYGLRRRLTADARRHARHGDMVRRVNGFLVEEGIFRTEDLYDAQAGC
jgi:hypothetical protein